MSAVGFHPLADIFPSIVRPEVLLAEIGGVYLLAAENTERVKIGWSYDIARRAKTLQTGNSRRLRLVTFFAGTRKLEGGLKAIFLDRRVRGEWFDDSDCEIADIFVSLHKRWIVGGFYH